MLTTDMLVLGILGLFKGIFGFFFWWWGGGTKSSRRAALLPLVTTKGNKTGRTAPSSLPLLTTQQTLFTFPASCTELENMNTANPDAASAGLERPWEATSWTPQEAEEDGAPLVPRTCKNSEPGDSQLLDLFEVHPVSFSAKGNQAGPGGLMALNS